jgi:hypothetical protein
VTRLNSRAKGARGELEFIQNHLAPHWPQACRNLDQYGPQKQDALNVAGVHWQIKRTEHLQIWAALRQAEKEAAPHDLPIVAFRRNRNLTWYCALEAAELIPLLRLRDTA